MIALPEEMDWLVYAAYGLIADFGLLIADWDAPQSEIRIPQLQLGVRPFELLSDNRPIPTHFSPERRALWEARMKAIRENEHIRRIEQPAYKRRWYRKVSDEQEFQRACEWWLMEKAEWWLEKKANGGPVTLAALADRLWEDERVRAVCSDPRGPEDHASLGMTAPGEFARYLKSIVVESTVPDWILPAMPWEQVEKKHKKKVSARAKKIRGKLNVPRERFGVQAGGRYVWVGVES